MPPFNLSCQVRIRCFYIRSEWDIEVQLDCWGQLLCTVATLNPSWSSHASFGSFLDLLTHLAGLLLGLILLQVFPGPEAWSLVSRNCHAPVKLTSERSDSSSWPVLFCFLLPPPISSRQDAIFTLTHRSLSAIVKCPPVTHLVWVCVYRHVFL